MDIQNTIYQILGLSSLAIIISEFKPLQNLNHLFLKSSNNIVLNLIGKIIECSKCTSLWMGIIYYTINLSTIQDVLFITGITVITTMYIHKKISLFIK